MRISDWSSDVCSSDLPVAQQPEDRIAEALQIGLRERRLGRQQRCQCHQAEHRQQPGDLALTRRHRVDALGDVGSEGERRPTERCERSEEHTSELQSLMRISYAVFCLKKKKKTTIQNEYKYTEQNDINTLNDQHERRVIKQKA